MNNSNFRFTFFLTLCFSLCVSMLACTDAKELLDLALNPPGRHPVDQSRVGVNNFFVDSEFGSIKQQYREIKDTLGLKFVRVLFAWTDAVQPSPNSPANYSFYDQIMANVPPGVDVLIVLAHTPSWMTDPANWIQGNPRLTWIEKWLKPTVRRYASSGGITGWEVFNEPNLLLVPSDSALGLEDPANYMELLRLGSTAIRSIDPSRFVVIAATESINQKFPNNLDYNKALRDMGAESLVDIWNIHYYSKNFEQVVTSNGIGKFLNGLTLPIWITESGQTGPNNQLAYAETVWPFLRDEVPGIDRIYWFQYGETGPIETNTGLKTTDPAFPVSDLYIDLRDR